MMDLIIQGIHAFRNIMTADSFQTAVKNVVKKLLAHGMKKLVLRLKMCVKRTPPYISLINYILYGYSVEFLVIQQGIMLLKGMTIVGTIKIIIGFYLIVEI